MFKSWMHKYFGLIIAIFLCVDLSVAQKKDDSFELAVATIKKNVHCCSVAFSDNGSSKVTTVLIFRNGEMTIVYNNKKIPVSFNLFELDKDPKVPLGVYYKRGSKTIVFNIEEFNTQAIHFNMATKASETYKQILYIMKLGRAEKLQ